MWNVGFVDRSDRSQYVDIIASSDVEAKAIVKRQYNPYRIFQCVKIRKITSRDENKMEDSMKKYAEDKYGRTYTLEEIEDGKVKARNMSGREKIFSGWKEAEEEFRSKGITILDSFYDVVEDSIKDEERLWKVYLTGPSEVNDIMYVKADNEAAARKIAERNTDEEVIKIREYGDTPLTKIDKEKILRNPNRYFDSEKKIEKIVKIVSKLK